MQIKNNILLDLENLFNANAQGIKFVIGRPAVLYDSQLVLERFGEPDRLIDDPDNPGQQINAGEEWYEVITQDFVPIAVADFNAGFISQPDVRAFSAGIALNFFVNFEKEDEILAAMHEIVDTLPGARRSLADNYVITYSGVTLPRFSTIEVYNDIRFIQYRVDLNILALQDTFSLNDVNISLALPSAPNTFIKLPVMVYSSNKGRDTTVVQQPNTNTAKVLVKNSIWTATIRFFLSLKTSPNLKSITEEIIKIVDDNSKNQNAVFNLRIEYPFINYTVTKSVLITNLQLDISREELTSIQIAVEEAYQFPTIPEVY